MKQIARVLRVGLFLLLLITFFGTVLTAVKAQDDKLSVTLTSEPVSREVGEMVTVFINYTVDRSDPNAIPQNIALYYYPPQGMSIEGTDWQLAQVSECPELDGNICYFWTIADASVASGQKQVTLKVIDAAASGEHLVVMTADGLEPIEQSGIIQFVQQTAVTPSPPPPTATLTASNFVIITQTVSPIGNGIASLKIIFKNTGEAVPGAKLVLRYPQGTLEIEEATLNGSAENGELQKDQGGHEWLLPPIDGRDGEMELHIRRLNVLDMPPDSPIAISFVSAELGEFAGPFNLEYYNKRELELAALTSTTPTTTPLATSSPPTTEVPLTATLPSTPTVTSVAIPIIPDETAVTDDDTTNVIEESADIDATDATVDSTNNTTDDEAKKTFGWVWLIIIPLLLLAIVLIAFLIWRSRKKPPPIIVPPPPPPVSSTAYLTRVSDGRHFDVAPLPFTIGRGAENALVIDESFENWQTVSRTHANIYQHAQGYVAEDQGSQNKIKVQGRTTRKSLVKDGWMLSIGGVEFIFNDGSNAGRTA